MFSFADYEKKILLMTMKGKTSDEIIEVIGGSIEGFRKFMYKHHPKAYQVLLANNRKRKDVVYVEKAIRKANVDIDQLLQQGYSIQMLSKEINVSPQTVKKYLEKARPEIYESFLNNGKSNRIRTKITDSDLERMIQLSQSGMGIDSIGKLFNVDGTAVRHRLIQEYGIEEYQRIHSKDRYDDNNGWNGKSIEYNGVVYQSMAEVQVAKVLIELGLSFDAHCHVTMKDGKVYYPDFYVKELDLFIEYAGMLNKNFYRAKFAKKVNDYSLNNIKFMVVVLETLPNLKENLRRYV